MALPPINLTIAGNIIKNVGEIEDLGLNVTTDLKWKQHFEVKLAKAKKLQLFETQYSFLCSPVEENIVSSNHVC